MLFMGVDLAWSTKNGTGISIIEGDEKEAKLISSEIVFSDEEILQNIRNVVGNKNAFIAIDAPLLVPNENGRRVAEEVVGTLFRKYDAGAHPANRKRLSSWTGSIRGEDISKLLESENFIHDPFVKKLENSRKFFEVYPHPSMVVLFDLNKILQYKNKPNRDYNFRYAMFKEYQRLLKALPNLELPPEISERKIEELKGKALKNYEDVLDSIFCAYIAYYVWLYPDKCAVLGDMKRGYILTPIFDEMREQLKSMSSQKNLAHFK